MPMKLMQEHPVYARMAILLALPLALVAAIPSWIGLYLTHKEVGDRTAQNGALIAKLERSEARQTRLRLQNRAAVRNADISLCRDLEKTKEQLRSIVTFDEPALRETLDALNIDPESLKGQLLIQRSKRSADEALAKLAARKGGCDTLPKAQNVVPEKKAPQGATTNGTTE